MSNRTSLYVFIATAILFFIAGLITCNAHRKDCPEVVKSDTTHKLNPPDSGSWHKPTEDNTVDSMGVISMGHWYSIDSLTQIGGNRVANTSDNPVLWIQGDSVITFDHDLINHDLDYYGKTFLIDSLTGSVKLFNTTFDSTRYKKLITDYNNLQKAYGQLAAKLNSVHNYTDTTHLKNGIVKVQSVVSQNILQKQRVILDSSFSTTVKNTISAKEKTQLWFGLDAYGNKKDYLNGAGVSLLLKFPKIAIDAGTYFDQYNNLNFRAGIKFLIKLKR